LDETSEVRFVNPPNSAPTAVVGSSPNAKSLRGLGATAPETFFQLFVVSL